MNKRRSGDAMKTKIMLIVRKKREKVIKKMI
jgi:hypothetical protein